MSAAADLRADLNDLVFLAVSLERYADHSDAVRDVLKRLHRSIRSTHDKVMREGAEVMSYAVANFGGLT